MLRKLILALSVLAITFAGSASAQSTIPQHVNLHNGYIEIHSTVVVTAYGRTENEPVKLFLMRSANTCCHDIASVHTNGTGVFNTCCILAGTLYHVRSYILGKENAFLVRPILCNVRGIPFGYAKITMTGHLTRDSQNYWVGEVTPHVTDAPCPVDVR